MRESQIKTRCEPPSIKQSKSRGTESGSVEAAEALQKR